MILNYLRIFGHSIHQNALTVCSTRKLFTKEFLRVTEFESQRLKTRKFVQPDTVVETIEFQLRAKNREELIKSFKPWIHVIDRSQCKEHFSLLMKCLLFLRDNPHPDPPKNFNFGPVVMRMFHSLNMSQEAINIAHNFETADLFDDATSPIILCDLLFNNGMYNEVLRVVQRNEAMNEKRDMKTTRLLNCITFATCYKLNTQDHFSFALEIWNKSVKENQHSQAINFLCMNAVNP
ncbi:pentatricopeptide repeat-containing protein 2, mitochondrial-like [Contarinia nasturtii]|uniref:pentatricopeptide repeat-containing protein 2, mitochondrial-like n=1 Tax=Contarinia nasturtii TaxID=265458 RepID=UPI0012D3E058|nr:pentatricopeptide repeat-containing protein 2, mitochondrial-like [Contarinia nasturtii]